MNSMRYLKITSLSALALAGLISLTGCASDGTVDEPTATVYEGGEAFWISMDLARPTGDESESTRAGEAAGVAKDDAETKIQNLVVLIVDTDEQGKPSYVRGVSQSTMSVETLADGKTQVKANMGQGSLFTRQHKYRVYAFANLPSYTNYRTLVNHPFSEVREMLATTAVLNAPLGTRALPLSSLDADAEKVQMWLEGGAIYNENSPYRIQEDTDKDDPTKEAYNGVLYLTPMHSRLDFAANADAYKFPIGYAAEGATKTEVKVQFKKAQVYNAANSVYVLPKAGTGAYTFASPTTAAFVNGSVADVKEGAAFYVPEYIPVATSNNLAYNKSTYVQLDGVLVADDACTELAPEVKKAIQEAATKKAESPALYYFDDGTYQSALTTKAHTETGWKKLTYSADVNGYKVTYRHAVRHDAGAGKNLEDGKVEPMEYGIVRNHIYTITINSVNALPHPWASTDYVENTENELSVRINPPAKWTYHRGGHEISFEN